MVADFAVSAPEGVWAQYEEGLGFNERINLQDCIRANEDFFVGKQWEGVEAGGLPTPVFNFLKRVVLFEVASITTDNVKLRASAMGAEASDPAAKRAAAAVSAEFDAIFERCGIVDLCREAARDAAVDGDGCLYTYWEQPERGPGRCVTETVGNDRVFFGDPNDRRVQKQPYIIISSREYAAVVRERCRGGGEDILPDSETGGGRFGADGKVTVLLKLRRDKKTGRIMACEVTRSAVVRPEWDTGLTLYPVAWLNWDPVKDCYHGQAMITGLIPNQIFVNKAYAMSMLSLMASAYPKTLYDTTRIRKWDNRVGGAVGVAGGDLASAARILEPARISPQIAQFIDKAVEHTQTFLGATDAALGNGRPDNAAAIIALQRASAVPAEITRQNLYRMIEEQGRIYMDFMAGYYGVRTADLPVPEGLPDGLLAMAGVEKGGRMRVEYDFSVLRDTPMTLKLDVGASSYWSEIASIETLDNLLRLGAIDIVDYLERVPAGYIADQEKLLQKYRQRLSAGADAAAPKSGAAPAAERETAGAGPA